MGNNVLAKKPSISINDHRSCDMETIIEHVKEALEAHGAAHKVEEVLSRVKATKDYVEALFVIYEYVEFI